MKKISVLLQGAFRFAIIALAYTGLSQGLAQEPCPESDGDIGECKAVSYSHLTLPTRCHRCSSRGSP